ncbi:helix-turn-helix transcriptional regulator [Bifidobacterium xylocopae]|uniref:helix-turn-helix transcriptional regulator n=1 Tax=Bifidobacterium xylocopae TaxID=2493119 RepID=UPI001F230680|nr:helix-turn-helix transcriptional regulator [Bifidobacterium xylocopae]
MSFRTNLHCLRSQRHMTQEQLAMLVGVSRQAVSKWESEKAYPEMDKLLAICDLFGCTLDDLVLGDVRVPGSGAKSQAQACPSVNATASEKDARPSAGGQPMPPAQSNRQAASPAAAVAGAAVGPAAGPEPASIGGAAASPAFGSGPTVDAAVAGPAFGHDVTGYDELRRSYSWHIGAGCAAILLGVAANVALAGNAAVPGRMTAATAWGLCCLMVGITAGLALIIPANLRHADFRRQHPFIEDFYSPQDRSAATRQLGIGLAVGIGLILLGVALGVTGQEVWRWSGATTGAAIVAAVACGVLFIVTCGLRASMIKIDAYNRGAEFDDNDGKEPLPGKWKELDHAITGTIMSLATIIAFLMLFTGNATNFFGLPIPFWLFWVIGGVISAIVNSVLRACIAVHR